MFVHELKSMRKRKNARSEQVSFMIGIIKWIRIVQSIFYAWSSL